MQWGISNLDTHFDILGHGDGTDGSGVDGGVVVVVVVVV